MVVTSDKQLRFWDYTRTKTSIPMVVYPSQLFALLIKVCGRSTNDIKSFISFINIKPVVKQISMSKANAILSAIGSLTDDFNTQKLLVASVFDDEFQKVITSAKDEEELYEMSKTVGRKLIDQRFELQEEQITEVQHKVTNLEEELKKEKQLRRDDIKEYEEKQSEARNKYNKQTELIDRMALRHTAFPYHLVWTFFPIIALLLGVGLSVLVIIGIFGKPESNLTLRLIEWFKATPIGGKMPDAYGWLFPGAICLASGAFLYSFPKLFSLQRKEKRIEYKKNYLEKCKND